jgi:uncharacterized protein (DUF2147 family)
VGKGLRLLQTAENTEEGNFYSCYLKDVGSTSGRTYYSTIRIESSANDLQEKIGIEILVFEDEF